MLQLTYPTGMHVVLSSGRFVALLLALGLSAASLKVRADLPEGCTELGLGLTEHTCFHARFGPFEERAADPGERASDATADINPVHTHFKVGLPQPVSVITYTPERSGEWAAFVDPDVPLRVLAKNGEERSVLLSHDVKTCPYLPRLRVYSLERGERYRFVLGPTSATEVVLVNEKVDDFVSSQGRDRDMDGYGGSTDTQVSACVAPAGFAENDTDCNDEDSRVHPGAPELCDGVDQNCNGLADDVGASCSAGSGSCKSEGKLSCPVEGEPARCSAEPQKKSVAEICNGEDDDCDGKVDNGSDAELCGKDPDRPRCVSSGTSFFCGCELNSDCGGPDSGKICQLERNTQRCVSGCVEGRTRCPDGQRCTSNDPARPGFCASCCESDAECAGRSAERPRCAQLPAAEQLLMCEGRVIGAQWYYDGDAGWQFVPVRTEARMCVECIQNADCADRKDGRVACLGPNGTCARCDGQDVSRCSARGDGLACLRSGDCGCRTDADCASDRRCHIERQRCEPRPPAPKQPKTERTVAGSGSITSAPLVPTDAAVPDNESLDAGAIQDAGQMDGRDAESAARSVLNQDRSGCSCHVASGRSAGGWLMFLWLAVFLWRRRRVRVLALLGATLIAGCGAEDPPGEASARPGQATTQTGGAHAASAPRSSAGSQSNGSNPEPSTTQPQGDADAGLRCTPELGEALLEHSCQHATIGPFVDVNAVGTRGLALSEVSLSHRTYRISLPSATGGEEFITDGWVRYRPSRDGKHVFFVKPALPLRVLAADVDTGADLRRLHDQSIEQCPENLNHGTVYELERGVVYYLGLLREAGDAVLFVEHIDTFGAKAWADDCHP